MAPRTPIPPAENQSANLEGHREDGPTLRFALVESSGFRDEGPGRPSDAIRLIVDAVRNIADSKKEKIRFRKLKLSNGFGCPVAFLERPDTRRTVRLPPLPRIVVEPDQVGGLAARMGRRSRLGERPDHLFGQSVTLVTISARGLVFRVFSIEPFVFTQFLIGKKRSDAPEVG